MLRIATKATVVTGPRATGGGLDTRDSFYFYPTVILSHGDDVSVDLDSFRQGARFGRNTNLYHRKVSGRLQLSAANPATGYDHSWEGDNWGDTAVETFRADYRMGSTVYMTHVHWPNWWGHGQPYDATWGTMYKAVHTPYGWQLHGYRANVRADQQPGALPEVVDWEPLDKQFEVYASYQEIGGDLSDSYVEGIKRYVTNLISSDVDADRRDGEAIHDTLVRESVDDVISSYDVNNIENLINVCEVVYSLVTSSWDDLLASVRKAAQDLTPGKAWLAYRYQYLTTKSDIEATIEHAIRDLPSDSIRRGRAGRKVGSTQYHATCIAASHDYSDTRAKVINYLENLGLAPTWARIWDLVPFSFVVDWFIPFSDFSEEVRINNLIRQSPSSTKSLAFYSFIYSMKTEGDFDVSIGEYSGSISYSDYSRMVAAAPTVSSEIAWYREDPKTRTWVKRALDSASILYG